MATIQKTDVSGSPLLKPVIERSYTMGLDLNDGQSAKQPEPPKAQTPPPPKPGAQTNPKPNFTPPPPPPPGPPIDDTTKPFSFNEEIEDPNDIGEDGEGPGVTLPTGSAKTFANFAGDALQIYLPKLTYGYVKIDMDNVIFNVQQGNLQNKWIDAFQKINENTEEALKIPDDSIKMWKKAFKDYLESENIAFANPKTAFIAATLMLLVDQGVRAYSIRKQNEKFMEEALRQSNPDQFVKAAQKKETSEKEDNGRKDAA